VGVFRVVLRGYGESRDPFFLITLSQYLWIKFDLRLLEFFDRGQTHRRKLMKRVYPAHVPTQRENARILTVVRIGPFPDAGRVLGVLSWVGEEVRHAAAGT
jgi:hypothetical protein